MTARFLWIVFGFALSGVSVSGCGGGGPCAKSVENTAKWGSEMEKKLAAENKDNYIKACKMGMDQSPDEAKVVECQAKAADEAAFKACR